MPYREMELARLCVSCKRPVGRASRPRERQLEPNKAEGNKAKPDATTLSVRCRRCGDPVCELHNGGAHGRCVNCESDYLGIAQKWNNRMSGFALTTTVVCILVMAAASVTFFKSITYPAILNWLLVAPFGAWGIAALGPKLARRSFLAERPSTQKIAGDELGDGVRLLEAPAPPKS